MLKKKVVKDTLELEQELELKIKRIDRDIAVLNIEREQAVKEIIEIKLSPFKIGDYVLTEVSNGKSKKECKCLLECENGMVFTRPVKDNGELSGRHFYLSPMKYSELKKC